MSTLYLHTINHNNELVPVQCDGQGRLYVIDEPSCIEQQNNTISPLFPRLASLVDRHYGYAWSLTNVSAQDFFYGGIYTITLTTAPTNHRYVLPSDEKPACLVIVIPDNAAIGLYRLQLIELVDQYAMDQPVPVVFRINTNVVTFFANREEISRVYHPAHSLMPSSSVSDYRDPVRRINSFGGFRHNFQHHATYHLFCLGNNRWQCYYEGHAAVDPQQYDTAPPAL